MTGWMARSLAGHDKDKIYIILKEDEEHVFLCDGVIRTIDNPKKKNKKHVQPIKHNIDIEIQNRLLQNEAVKNEEIKRAIKLYLKEL